MSIMMGIIGYIKNQKLYQNINHTTITHTTNYVTSYIVKISCLSIIT